jgi:hypothetical protein
VAIQFVATVTASFASGSPSRVAGMFNATAPIIAHIDPCNETVPGSVPRRGELETPRSQSSLFRPLSPSLSHFSTQSPSPSPSATGSSWRCVCPPGTFRDRGQCFACPSGSESTVDDATRCTCLPMHFRADHLCPACLAGSVSFVRDATRCMCDYGFVLRNNGGGGSGGHEQCVRCDDNRNTTTRDARSCICPADCFTDPETAACVRCDPATSVVATSRTRCACLAGFAPSATERNRCTLCAHGSGAAFDATECVCERGFTALRAGGCGPCAPGWFGPMDAAGRCERCPRHGFCVGGTSFPVPIAGAWTAVGPGDMGVFNTSLRAVWPTLFVLCRAGTGACDHDPAAAAAAAAASADAESPATPSPPSHHSVAASTAWCADGYRAYLCGACAAGFGRFLGACRACNQPRDTIVLVLTGLAFVVILVFLVASSLRPKSLPSTMIRVAVNYAQTASFIGTLGFAYPVPVLRMNQATAPASAGLHVLSLSCGAGVSLVSVVLVSCAAGTALAVAILGCVTFDLVRAARQRRFVGARTAAGRFAHRLSAPLLLLPDPERDNDGDACCNGDDLRAQPELPWPLGAAPDNGDDDDNNDASGEANDADSSRFLASETRRPFRVGGHSVAAIIVRVLVVVSSIAIPTVTSQAISVLRPCVGGGGGGGGEASHDGPTGSHAPGFSGASRGFLADDTLVPCDAARAVTARALAVVALILFALAVPATLFAVLAAGERALPGIAAHPVAYLARGFKWRCRTWEAVVLSRKIGIILIAALLPSDLPMQAFLASVLLIIALLAHVSARPFTEDHDQALSVLRPRTVIAATLADNSSDCEMQPAASRRARVRVTLLRLLVRVGGPHRLEQLSLLANVVTVLMGPLFRRDSSGDGSDPANTPGVDAADSADSAGSAAQRAVFTAVLFAFHVPVMAISLVAVIAAALGRPKSKRDRQNEN